MRWIVLTVLCVAHINQQSLADNQSESDSVLVGQVEYWFVGHLGQMDDKGRLLVWEATIEGELAGKMKWWFVNPPVIAEVAMAHGRVSFYTARWEVWTDGELLLAGESAGKTVFSDDADGIWDGHGRVTEAVGRFSDLIGRQIYETGPVILGSDPPKSFKGSGAFVVY
jgi:hypothetical protein